MSTNVPNNKGHNETSQNNHDSKEGAVYSVSKSGNIFEKAVNNPVPKNSEKKNK